MEKQETNSLEELNKIFRILSKHIKLIISTVVVTVLVFAIGVFFVVKPKYQATSEIIVSQRLDRDTQAAEQQQIQSTDLQLVNTYKSILSSQTVGNSVKHKVGNKIYKDSELNVSTDTNSQVININVTSHDANQAARIANITASTFKSKIKNIMNVNNVSIISKAREIKKPIFPKKGISLLAGALVGIILGMFLALLGEFNDKTISTTDFIEKDLGLINLGTISDIDMQTISKQIKK
ncbi:chain-length determining protein [Apilactobacillus kunkeei]|uniref:YveK family protein n=1 Tax=Apilactobacillus kunkeei TaxID=148814 RepID=UPI0006C5DBD0|nr:Wzz/FepE/Etk N-terminal domain-containing protein [Apilactobacillus kunkeei]KOY71930.1 Capsular polysaccharide biosynthesis protein [Apilactobacillus kunkeei DSM 12361 = ATCC 700308]QYU52907.1 chain-length determining protein [Apilactobacillus kunkeei]